MDKKKEIEKSEEDEFVTSFQNGFQNPKQKVYEPSEKEMQDELNKMKLIDIQILKDQNHTLYQKKLDKYNQQISYQEKAEKDRLALIEHKK